jgi:hypothetical protein
MNARVKPILAAVLALALGAGAANAQSFEVRPMFLLDGGPTAGVRLTSDFSRERIVIGPFPRSWHVAAFADAPLFLDADRNPETLRARLDGGVLVSLFRPFVPEGGIPTPNDPPPWNLGYIAAQITLATEAPQDVNTADVMLGASIEYGHDLYHQLWFLPEARLGWDAVMCVECDPGADQDETGSRLYAEARWSIPADRGWMPAPLRPFWLRLEGRAFRANGVGAVEPLRNENGTWGGVELAYRCDACGPVHEVYVRGQSGDLPLALREDRAVTAGVSLVF